MPNVKDTIPSNVVKGTKAVNLSASALAKTGPGFVHGVYVASTTGGTIKLWDALTATTPVLVNTFTPAVGWHELPFVFSTGLYVTIANTIDCTLSIS